MKTTRRILAAATFALATMTSGFSQMAYNCEGCPPVAERNVINLSSIADANGNLPANALLTCENLYILDRKIYAPVGSQVTILAGTVIKAENLGEFNSAAFIVPRGAKVYANGSECCPIIFTSVDDNLDGTFDIFTKETWGGIIILGYAHNTVAKLELNPENNSFAIGDQTAGIGFIEGVDPADSRHHYGAEIELGTPFNNFDNSGVLNYVSIRHGGTELGTANEINGLTLGSVGSGTVLRNIEIVSNGDDGIEFFGGTVDLKYARIMYVEDDYLDWDQGYTGRIQHVLAVTRPTTAAVQGDTLGLGDNGIEADGDDGTGFARGWYSEPIVSNVTMIGRTKDVALELKERTKGEIYNSIFANFATGIKYNNANLDTVVLKNNTFVNNITNVSGTPVTGLEPATDNTFVTTLTGMTYSNWTSVWDAIPSSTGAALNVKNLPDDADKVAYGWYAANYYNWFDAVDYQGAFKPGASPWWSQASCPMLQDARADFESLVSFPAGTDLNGDGVTNSSDLTILIGRYNKANDE